MPALEIISLSVNSISSLAAFAHCPLLKEIYLRNNHVESLQEVRHLMNLTELRTLWLSQNPCAEDPDYRIKVISMLPQLQKLDNFVVEEAERFDAAAYLRLHPISALAPVEASELLSTRPLDATTPQEKEEEIEKEAAHESEVVAEEDEKKEDGTKCGLEKMEATEGEEASLPSSIKKSPLSLIDPNVKTANLIKAAAQLKKRKAPRNSAAPPLPQAPVVVTPPPVEEASPPGKNVTEAILCLASTLDDSAFSAALEKLQELAVKRGLRGAMDGHHARARPVVGRHEAPNMDQAEAKAVDLGNLKSLQAFY